MLLLTEEDVQEIFPMEKALERIEASFLEQHQGAVNRSRQRIFRPGVSLHYMAASLPGEKLIGLKIYTISRSALRFLVLLYDDEAGALEAFAQEMARRLRLPVEPTESAEDAVRFGDIVITATHSAHPVLAGEWLGPGTHVNAIGANMVNRRAQR